MRRGFTLTEVLISMVILTIITVAFSGVFGQQYKMLRFTSDVTKDTFSTVERTEQEIQLLKDSIQDGMPVDNSRYTLMNVTLFNTSDEFKRDVEFYAIDNGIRGYEGDVSGYESPTDDNSGENRIITYVSANKRVVYETPEIPGNIVIEFVSAKGEKSTKFGRITGSGESITTSHASPVPAMRTLEVRYQWYVSREGYYKHYEEYAGETDGYRAPVYPNDYKAIPGEAAKELSLLKEEYRGRFLTLSVQPVSLEGVLGGQQVSNPIYIGGLPLDDSSGAKILHFDASLANVNDAKIVTMGDSKYLSEWQEIYKSGANANMASNSEVAQWPELITEKVRDIDILVTTSPRNEYATKPVFIDFLRFTGKENLVANVASTMTNDPTMVFIGVFRANDQNALPFSFVNPSASAGFSFNGITGVMKTVGGMFSLESGGGPSFENDTWMIVELSTNEMGWLSAKIDGQEVSVFPQLPVYSSLSLLAFGQAYDGAALSGSETDIAEFIMAGQALSLSDKTAVYEYLADKYGIELS